MVIWQQKREVGGWRDSGHRLRGRIHSDLRPLSSARDDGHWLQVPDVFCRSLLDYKDITPLSSPIHKTFAFTLLGCERKKCQKGIKAYWALLIPPTPLTTTHNSHGSTFKTPSPGRRGAEELLTCLWMGHEKSVRRVFTGEGESYIWGFPFPVKRWCNEHYKVLGCLLKFKGRQLGGLRKVDGIVYDRFNCFWLVSCISEDQQNPQKPQSD